MPIGLGMAGYVLWEARRAGVSTDITQHMLRNVAIDFVGGLLPVVGDAFDAIFKANTRNTRLLKNYLEEQLSIEPPPPAFPWTLRIPANVTGHSGDRDRFAHGLHAGTGFVL